MIPNQILKKNDESAVGTKPTPSTNKKCASKESFSQTLTEELINQALSYALKH